MLKLTSLVPYQVITMNEVGSGMFSSFLSLLNQIIYVRS
jgi:hypothetical protein